MGISNRMIRHLGVFASLFLLLAACPCSSGELGNILEDHDPTQTGVPGAASSANLDIPAGQELHQEGTAADPYAAILDRLTKLLDRVTALLERLVGIMKVDPESGKPQTAATATKTSTSTSTGTQTGTSTVIGKGALPDGAHDVTKFGYSGRYQPVWDIAEQFCRVNQKYSLGAGHRWSGYTGVTDCSGFTSHFYQTLCMLAGVPPVFPKSGGHPSSTAFKSSKYTNKITSQYPPPNPQDLIKPGDIFILDKGGNAHGHIGVFMGYDKSGNALIAHSTTRKTKSSDVAGNVGHTGGRIEPMPSWYRSRFAGIYRIKGTDEALEKLSKS